MDEETEAQSFQVCPGLPGRATCPDGPRRQVTVLGQVALRLEQPAAPGSPAADVGWAPSAYSGEPFLTVDGEV